MAGKYTYFLEQKNIFNYQKWRLKICNTNTILNPFFDGSSKEIRDNRKQMTSIQHYYHTFVFFINDDFNCQFLILIP